ncbi:MAG TPA: phage tail tape measure protein [Bauldia sp.]|nr:phage tail tape measure protein [Bauldia sp.]
MTQIDELSIRISADTTPFRAALRDLGREADGFSAAITRAFKDAIVGGRSFEQVLSSLALRIAGIALDSALKPIGSALGNALAGAFGLAEGGVVGGGRVKAFAKGGLTDSPMFFPLANGLGLLGEAGPEAVLPLSRGSDGRLGVRTEGGGGAPVIHFHVTTPDAESFRKSEAQVTAMLARAVGRGRRGL